MGHGAALGTWGLAMPWLSSSARQSGAASLEASGDGWDCAMRLSASTTLPRESRGASRSAERRSWTRPDS